MTGAPRARATGPLLLGVRHHGPGSARAVRAALEACPPRVVLIEGPPEADAIVGLAAEKDMRPPVALLAHAADDPGRAGFWPLAGFSPEWAAIQWALAHEVPVRFIDLPAANTLAMAAKKPPAAEPAPAGPPVSMTAPVPATGADPAAAPAPTDPADPTTASAAANEPAPAGSPIPAAAHGPAAELAPAGPSAPAGVPGPAAEPGPLDPAGPAGQADQAASAPASVERLRVDPLAVLSEAAGYDDPERWWEDVIEHRGTGGAEAFAAVAEAMEALRAEYGHGGHEDDAVREAHMRLRLREARREFGDEVAVVCGAWHVPALAERTTATADRKLLKGLPKVKTEISWVPWTHRRLARHSGYGAGITSPGWYDHLFHAPDRPVERWLTKVAGLLRDEDFAVSSAHVIEAVRLAGTLAAMRGRPLAGLAETIDAVRAVMCDGSDVPIALVRDRLVVGDILGEVPESAPAVPLQRDLTRTQRSLRLKPEALERELELDLRKDTDAGRSRLLHRLRLLGVDWGTPAVSRGSTGTFRETWRLGWEPELAVRVAEAGVWGTTVLSAATAKAETEARSAKGLAEVTELAERCLLAGLSGALPVVMRSLADRAALDADVGHLAQALPALVRSVRYGDVRGTDTAALGEVAVGLAERILVGLPPACVGLDADGAAEMRRHMEAVHRAIALLSETETVRTETTETETGTGTGPEAGARPHARTDMSTADLSTTETRAAGSRTADGLRARWAATLRNLAGRDGTPATPGLIRGRAARLLLDDGRLAEDEAARLMGLALSPGTQPPEAASWIEGFIGGGAGGGLLLVHDERLLGLVDRWLISVPAEAFTDVLPLLRRTFSAYDTGVRRTLGELVRRGPAADGPTGADGQGAPAAPGFGPGLDPDRAAAVVPTVRLLLGLDPAPHANDPMEAAR
ncbi:DUF5682 family protein [Streptomyces rugosispiralis]|uniref:DUF5682 family protein n=1 Tax=Streptomyces rugosispiralis TaxID=2967341 RepID=A0ABT1UVQ8_9ACTN|nr:DUF5682 family protein [Streptomyces rugosispiralis]MCQ8189219.1 DUF5682 family protein [Streptomyces rugosispiralis]